MVPGVGADDPVDLCVDVRRNVEFAVEGVRDAWPDREDVRIRLRSSTDGADGRWSLLVGEHVRDLGRKTLEHAFDPFFSRRAAGWRPGPDLTVVRRMLEAHGGTTSVRKGSEGGGCLVVTLPIDGTTRAAT